MPTRLGLVIAEGRAFLTHRLGLAAAAKASGYEVTIFTRDSGQEAELAATGLPIVKFEMARGASNIVSIFSEALQLWKSLQTNPQDIIHLVSLRAVVVGGLASLFMRREKFVFALNGLGYLFTDGRENGVAARLLMSLFSVVLRRGPVIVQNRDDWDLVERCRIPSSGIKLIKGAGVDVSRFMPSEEPVGKPVIMLPSRLLMDKGVGEFVEAARILRARSVEARFILVGDPDSENPASVFEQDLREWVESGAVEHWGYMTQMEKVIPQASIVCLPSYREGLPKVLLEAMACGRPCVTTDATGCRDAVRHGDNGLLVAPKDPVALADSLQTLVLDKELRRCMGRRGRERALQEFADAIVIRQTLDVYEQLRKAA